MVFQMVVGLALLYLIPGYLLLSALKRRWDMVEKIGFAVSLSIILNMFLAYALAIPHILSALNLMVCDITLSLALLYACMRAGAIPKARAWKKIWPRRGVLNEPLAVLALCALVAGLVLNVHLSYTGYLRGPYSSQSYSQVYSQRLDFPLHADEWSHLAQAMYIMSSGGPGFTNPYFLGGPAHPDLESGFHIFTAIHFLLTGQDPVLGYKYLPAMFAALSALTLYLLTRKVTGNKNIGYLSILFFATLKSNINLMGLWFYIPLTMSFFILFCHLHLCQQLRQDKRDTVTKLLLLSTFAAAAATYPPLAALMAVLTIPYVIKSGVKPRYLAAGAIAAGGAYYLLKDILPSPLFTSDWTTSTTGVHTVFNIITLFGPVNTILAVLGATLILRRRMDMILILMPLPTAANLISYALTDYTLLMPYQRNLYYFMLALTPLAASGLYFSLHALKTIMERNRLGAALSTITAAAVAAIIISYSLNNYYDISAQTGISNKDSKTLVPYISADEDIYKAAKYVKEQYGPQQVILTSPHMSFAIYPISGSHVTALNSANLGGEDSGTYSRFLKADCNGKKEIIKENNITAILTDKTISCPGLTLDKQTGRTNIYIVQ